MTSFTVPPEEDGERLDVVVARHLGEARNRAARRIADGQVQVGDVVALKSRRVATGEQVQVQQAPRPESGAAGVGVPPIRYEDDHLIVLAKPAGLVVHPGAGRPAGTLAQALAEAGHHLSRLAGEDRPGIVHRLDRDTSGLLVVAKTDEAYLGLTSALERHDVDRRYLALVEGLPEAGRGRVDAPIGRDPRDRKRFAVEPSGKPAVTHWRVLATGRAADGTTVSLVSCRLETGRTHQIRVHLAYAGHPVVGDRTYGARRDLARDLGLDRPFLHATRLRFDHPVTRAPIQVTEPLPRDLREALRLAGIEPG